jgi:hypothetical protein
MDFTKRRKNANLMSNSTFRNIECDGIIYLQVIYMFTIVHMKARISSYFICTQINSDPRQTQFFL